jgi:hypothetical protein
VPGIWVDLEALPGKAGRNEKQMSRINYIFVDFENVQEIDLERIEGKPVKVTLVLGLRHKHLPVKFVKQLLQHAGQVALVEAGREGRNALELILAAYIGEARRTDPGGYFRIVSRDKDFDALIGHLKDTGTFAARHATFNEVPVLMNAVERENLLLTLFKAIGSSRPKKKKALESWIQAPFGRTLSTAEVDEIVRELVAKEVITLSEKGDVAYKL